MREKPHAPIYAHAVGACCSRAYAVALRETDSAEPAKARLLDRVCAAASLRHYRRRTEVAYVPWIRRCILVHAKRHRAEMEQAEVTSFPGSLAVAD